MRRILRRRHGRGRGPTEVYKERGNCRGIWYAMCLRAGLNPCIFPFQACFHAHHMFLHHVASTPIGHIHHANDHHPRAGMAIVVESRSEVRGSMDRQYQSRHITVKPNSMYSVGNNALPESRNHTYLTHFPHAWQRPWQGYLATSSFIARQLILHPPMILTYSLRRAAARLLSYTQLSPRQIAKPPLPLFIP